MKRICKIFVGLIVLTSTLMLTGCLFDWEETYETWYQYNGDSLEIPVVAKADADSEESGITSGMMEDAEFYVWFSPDDGLKIAVQSTSEQEISIGNGLLTTTADIVTGGCKTYENKSDFSSLKWKALYASGLFEESSTPEVVAHPEKCIILAGDSEDGNANKFDFHWKRVLKQILINKLLGED